MNSVFNQIREILYKNYCINFEEIELEAEFELELGMDSRDFFELIEDFETIFKIDIFLDDLSGIITIEDAVLYIEKKIADQNNHSQN